MHRSSTDITVADYYAAARRGEVIVNKNYQRSDKVWPDEAKSFLIETILLGYPIPKLSLHQITDVKTRETRKEVVDGQQRSAAVWGFLDNAFKMSSRSEVEDARSKIYDEFPEDLKARLLDYSLSFDLFVSTTEDEVREVFRRINSFTVPLNAEEQRYAQFQGAFKWFIHRLTRDYDTLFVEAGIFTSKQVVRMQDTKLLTEVCHAYLHGITTTNKTQLTALYREKDKQFSEESELEGRIRAALDLLLILEDLHRTSLFKPFVAYSLILALIHCLGPVKSLQGLFPLRAPVKIEVSRVVPPLSALGEALDNEDLSGSAGDFVRASAKGTNVKAAREVRFTWLCRALTGDL